jgi:hypothetical protein
VRVHFRDLTRSFGPYVDRQLKFSFHSATLNMNNFSSKAFCRAIHLKHFRANHSHTSAFIGQGLMSHRALFLVRFWGKRLLISIIDKYSCLESSRVKLVIGLSQAGRYIP